MSAIWKRFMAWVTGLKSNKFQWARLKLTVIIAITVITLVIGYLFVLQREFNRYATIIAQEIDDPDKKARFISRSERVASTALFSVEPEDVASIIVSVTLSYFLAGLALRPIKRAMEQQRTFIINASHELKTPLTILKTEMETFLRNKEYKLTENILLRKRQAVLGNLKEIDRMSRTINELLLVAHIDTHNTASQFHPMALSLLVQQSMQQMRSYAVLKHVDISVKGNTKNVFIRADAEQLLMALTNVLKNAIDYSNKGEHVIMHIQQDNRWVKISIIDHGVGITPKDLPHIFERFYRGYNSLATEVTGSGLGLSIVHWIIAKHQGIVTAKSAVKKGTTITMSLPRISQTPY